MATPEEEVRNQVLFPEGEPINDFRVRSPNKKKNPGLPPTRQEGQPRTVPPAQTQRPVTQRPAIPPGFTPGPVGDGDFLNDLGRNAKNVFADTIAEGKEAAAEIAEAGAGFGEGSQADSGRVVRRMALEAGEGVLQTAGGLALDVVDPRNIRGDVADTFKGIGGFFGIGTSDESAPAPDAGVETPPGHGVTPQNLPSGRDILERNNQARGIGRERPDAAPSLSNLGSTAETAGSGVKADANNNFLTGVPDGFIEIIRGTNRYYLRQDKDGRTGRNSFKSVPGLSLEESEKLSSRNDPNFVSGEAAGFAQQRINNQTMQAESQRISAAGGAIKDGLDKNGDLVSVLPDGRGGFRKIDGFTPIMDAIAENENNRFDMQILDGVNPGIISHDGRTGKTTNHTEEERKTMVRRRYKLLTDGKNLSMEDQLEALEEISEQYGDTTFLEEIIRSGGR